MRINKYVAQASGLSRRKADELLGRGAITINDQPAQTGQNISDKDIVRLGNRQLQLAIKTTIMLNKPAGYVVSREGQGSPTIYELLPPEYQQLKPIGRLDKNSSGLLLLTNDGDLAQALTHPSQQKLKIYEVTLYKPLNAADKAKIERGIRLEDGLSKLAIKTLDRKTPDNSQLYEISMHEGRNRQIRRTFATLNYEVKTLHRTHFGEYRLDNLSPATSVTTKTPSH